jgi:hypothetical protein
MSGAGLSFGLNLSKKKNPLAGRPAPKRPAFAEPNSDDEGENGNGEATEEIGEFGGIEIDTSSPSKSKSTSKPSSKYQPPPSLKPKSKLHAPNAGTYDDLSTRLSSRKHAEAAESLDPSIYDYDSVYDSLKPAKPAIATEADRKPKYMTALLKSAEVRKRDAQIAEERKLAREREAEGEEFEGKEKFVTSAYKKLQEENRRAEEEERRREEEEAKQQKGKGMTGFYKNLLEREEQRHEQIVKAAEERIKAGPLKEEDGKEKQKTEAEIAAELAAKTGAKIAVNEEGEVVDKRQLLKGGLNIVSKPKPPPSQAAPDHHRDRQAQQQRGPVGSKQAQRERQSRMVEEQLAAATKRARDEEEEERTRIESLAKTRKTKEEIGSAKERYLARKREAEEAKRKEATS